MMLARLRPLYVLRMVLIVSPDEVWCEVRDYDRDETLPLWTQKFHWENASIRNWNGHVYAPRYGVVCSYHWMYAVPTIDCHLPQELDIGPPGPHNDTRGAD